MEDLKTIKERRDTRGGNPFVIQRCGVKPSKELQMPWRNNGDSRLTRLNNKEGYEKDKNNF